MAMCQRWKYFALPIGLALTSVACGSSSTSITSPTAATGVTPTVKGTGLTTLTYTRDIQPILATDCVSCHGSSQQQAGLNLSSYSGVMRIVAADNANSLLIQVTQPSGVMSIELSGNRTLKQQTIYDWVITSHAAQ
jgi:hypothetical protein